MPKRKLGWMLWFLAVALAQQSAAQDKPLKKIYWGVSTLSPTLWIPYVAKDAKLFEKNGLDVELVLLRGSGQTSQAMVAGSLLLRRSLCRPSCWPISTAPIL